MTIVLTPPGYASPPLRSSPLSKPPHNAKSKPSTATSSPPSRGPGPAVPIPRARRASSILAPSPLSVTVSPTTATPTPNPNPNPSPSPSSLSRSHPLLGSYPLSLLHARMSQHAPHTAADSFALYLKAVATGRCPAALRAPAPLTVPFVATYYDLAGGGGGASAGASHTPWVADVDLEGWFFSAYGGTSQGDSTVSASTTASASASTSDTASASTSTSDTASTPVSATATSTSGSSGSGSSLSTSPGVSLKTSSSSSAASSTAFPVAAPTTPPPHYPGYRVPPVGQLQIIVKTPSSAVKAYVLPYDLRELPLGGRLLARERTYVVSPGSTQSCPTPLPGGAGKSPASPASPETPTPRRESLRYAVQLQFVCAPAPPDEPPGAAYYVARTLKLVFTSRPDTAETRVERTDEVVPPASATPSSSPLAQSTSPLTSPFPAPHHPASQPPVSPASPSPRADEWTRVRKKYLARTATIRGFTPTPTPSRPATPAPEAVSAPPPRSLLSAFAPGDERAASPAPAPATPSKTATREAREARRKARRSSKIERELSEKLRALDVGRE